MKQRGTKDTSEGGKTHPIYEKINILNLFLGNLLQRNAIVKKKNLSDPLP